MTTQRESRFKVKVLDWLKEQGWKAWKNHGNIYTDGGMPDVMAIKNGRFVAFELKMPGGTATALQSKWIRELQAQNAAVAMVVWSIEEVKDAINNIDEQASNGDDSSVGSVVSKPAAGYRIPR